MERIENESEYLRGMKDCKEGKAHQAGQHKDYDRGYAIQYEFEQVKSWAGFN